MTPDTLKSLCERATKGPWMVYMDRPAELGVTTYHVATHVEPSIALSPDFWPTGYLEILTPPTDDCGYRQPDDHADVAENKVGNARLMAAMSAALPALVKLWEAVKDYQTWYRNEPITGSDRHAERQASNAIQSALSELEAL